MGTNYYKKIIPTEEVINELHRAVDMLDFDKINEIEKELTKGIHICKMSSGWSVVFDANAGKYFKPTRKDLNDWLKDGIIVNEYGSKFTLEKFWKEVDDWDADSHNWRNSSNAESSFLEDEKEFWKKKGYNVQGSEFVSEGLRFAIYTDFD